MTAPEWISAIFIFLLSGVLFLLSILRFMGRGPLLNNACFYTSGQACQTMDKSPRHRQSAVIFGLLGLCLVSLLSSTMTASCGRNSPLWPSP